MTSILWDIARVIRPLLCGLSLHVGFPPPPPQRELQAVRRCLCMRMCLSMARSVYVQSAL